MEKRELKEKILKAVGLGEELVDRVFSSFVKKIDAVLQVNQTIRIEDIGFFQSRVEPVSRLDRDSTKKSKRILIFKNIDSKERTLEGNPFLTLEIEQDKNEPSQFNESVFNLSIDKPSTIFSEVENEQPSNSDTQLDTTIHESVNQVIASGIILDGYELLNKDVAQQTDQFDDDHHLTSELFEEKNNNVLEDLISHPDEHIESSIKDELDSSGEEISKEALNEVDSIHQIKNESSEDISDEIGGIDKTDENNLEPKYSNPFDELNDLINKDKEPQTEDNQTNFNEFKSSVNSEDKGSKRLLFLAFAAVFIILLISIIYFTSAPSELSTQTQTYLDEKVDNTIEKPIQPPVKNGSIKVDSADILETSGDDKLLKESPELGKKEIQIPKSQTSYTGLYRRIEKDVSITDRIYFDGLKYTVQLSSWKSKTIAEHEVQKLKKIGFDAFIFRVFIKAKDGTYNRVRVGYFDSVNEAVNFLKRNKL